MKHNNIIQARPRSIRLLTLTLIASLVMSLAAASVASAAPEFKPTGATLTGTGGGVELSANNGAEKIRCEKSAATGTVSTALLIGGIVVHFLGCTSSSATKAGCSVKSTNTTAEGLILTTTLHGVLGTVLPGNGVGLLFLPISAKRFVTLAKNECTVETAMTGSIAGLVTPTGKSQTTGKVTFGVTAGKQNIAHIDLSTGGSVEPELVFFSTTATLVLEVTNTYSKATEVT